MRKYLLMGAALSLLAAGPAFADHDGGAKSAPLTIDAFVAYAAANNTGSVTGSKAELKNNQSSSVTTSGSFSGSKGVSSQAQNSGANSVLQNSLALAYVANPSNASHTIGIGVAVAGARNHGGVYGNTDETGPRSPWDNDDGTVKQSATISNSYNYFNGVAQSNQNVGDNSLLQNSTAVATVSPVVGTTGTLSVALAGSTNGGEVAGNHARNNMTQSSSNVDSSFNSSTGVFSLNQNSGANSLMQNSAAIGTVTLTPTSGSTLAASVATAMNNGEVERNMASAANGSNSASMSNSFNYSQGVLQASQNAGANSLIQNSVSVGAVN